jgi:hypothetical protein
VVARRPRWSQSPSISRKGSHSQREGWNGRDRRRGARHTFATLFPRTRNWRCRRRLWVRAADQSQSSGGLYRAYTIVIMALIARTTRSPQGRLRRRAAPRRWPTRGQRPHQQSPPHPAWVRRPMDTTHPEQLKSIQSEHTGLNENSSGMTSSHHRPIPAIHDGENCLDPDLTSSTTVKLVFITRYLLENDSLLTRIHLHPSYEGTFHDSS